MNHNSDLQTYFWLVTHNFECNLHYVLEDINVLVFEVLKALIHVQALCLSSKPVVYYVSLRSK